MITLKPRFTQPPGFSGSALRLSPWCLSENTSASHPGSVEGWLVPAQIRTLRQAQDAQLGFRI